MNNGNQIISARSKLFPISDTLDRVSQWFQISGATLLCILMLFTFTVVVLRYVVNRPLRGDVDITQLLAIGITWLGVAWAQVKKGHLKVDLITSRLSPRNAFIMETATYILIIAVASIITWQGISNTVNFVVTTRSSITYEIPLSPAAALIPLGSVLFLLVLLRDFIVNLNKAANLPLKPLEWFLMIGVPVIIMGVLLLWMQPISSGLLSKPTVAFIGIFVGLFFIFMGMPIGPALAMTGFVFVGNILGTEQGFMLAGADLFWLSADYSWSTIQLFILMSQFIVISGVGADAFTTAYKWLGQLRGGLAIATIGACTMLAAVVGIPAPVIYAMGSTGLPAMRKYDYSDKLAAGAIAAGSCLGPLIPPSVAFIFYGIFTGESIGKLFIAGIIPGLILAAGFIITIYIQCQLNPRLGGGGGEKFTWGEKFGALKGSAPILALFLLIMGGIYFGVFTTTEGGGIGAFLALVIAVSMKRVTWKTFKESLLESARTNAIMIFMVLGSILTGRILTVGTLGTMMANSLGHLSPLLIAATILIFYFIVGFFFDTITVLILTMPVLTPILKAAGVDLLWFGVELVTVINLGAYTPPYGLNLFVLTSATDLKLGTIFRGVWPFVYCNLAVCLVLFFFPAIVTWLPNTLK